LLGELFHEQSSRWGDIARDHVNAITDLVCRFIQSVCAFVIKDNDARETISRIITAKLDDNAECASQELVKLLDDEAGCPITTTTIIQTMSKERVTTVRGKILAHRSIMQLTKTGMVAFT
jgi:hypothetical protein